MKTLWAFWFLGMLIPFAIRYGSKTKLKLLLNDTTTAITTFISLTLQMLLGAWYIEDLPLRVMGGIQLVKHWAGALFLAAMLEMIAPTIVREVVSRIVDKLKKWERAGK
jgi:hypothetical protein